MIIVDARGENCPMPVIRTKKIMEDETLKGDVEVIVDNLIASQNVKKFAKSQGCEIEEQVVSETEYRIVIQRETGENPLDHAKDEQESNEQIQAGTILVISSEYMGNGDDTLGKTLMKGFVYALTQQASFPEKILLYNGGAKLVVEGADTLEDLTYLQSEGVGILTCGACLNFYELAEQVRVGEITNMYVIVEEMTKAKKIIKP